MLLSKVCYPRIQLNKLNIVRINSRSNHDYTNFINEELYMRNSVISLGCATLGVAALNYLFNKPEEKSEETQDESIRQYSIFNRFIKFSSVSLDNLLETKQKNLPQINRNVMSTGDLFRALLNDDSITNEELITSCPEILNLFPMDAIFSLTDYVFLTSILTTSKTKFKIAFDMIDIDQNNVICNDDFYKLKSILLNKMDKNIKNVKLTNKRQFKTFLDNYFFSSEHNHYYINDSQQESSNVLNYTNFSKFATTFKNLVLKLEFNKLDEKSENIKGITRAHFAEIILNQSTLSQETKLHRLQNLTNPNESFSYKDYESFVVLLNKLPAFKNILKWYTIANIPIKFEQMDRATKLATLEESDISENLIKLVIEIFDNSGDKILDNDEFLSVLKNQQKIKYI